MWKDSALLLLMWKKFTVTLPHMPPCSSYFTLSMPLTLSQEKYWESNTKYPSHCSLSNIDMHIQQSSVWQSVSESLCIIIYPLLPPPWPKKGSLKKEEKPNIPGAWILSDTCCCCCWMLGCREWRLRWRRLQKPTYPHAQGWHARTHMYIHTYIHTYTHSRQNAVVLTIKANQMFLCVNSHSI